MTLQCVMNFLTIHGFSVPVLSVSCGTEGNFKQIPRQLYNYLRIYRGVRTHRGHSSCRIYGFHVVHHAHGIHHVRGVHRVHGIHGIQHAHGVHHVHGDHDAHCVHRGHGGHREIFSYCVLELFVPMSRGDLQVRILLNLVKLVPGKRVTNFGFKLR